MQRLAEVEKKIAADPKEAEVRKLAKERSDAAAEALKNPEKAYADGKAALEKRLAGSRSERPGRRDRGGGRCSLRIRRTSRRRRSAGPPTEALRRMRRRCGRTPRRSRARPRKPATSHGATSSASYCA
ncbi:MAG: hypothetical protein RML56_05250 [Burkholderiales bacterium]|nr:hypothetical protein [Burkholderiales bacterium]